MASRNSPVAGDNTQPVAIPRRRDPPAALGDDSNYSSAHGSIDNGHTASSSLSSYHTARVQAATSMATNRIPPGPGRNTSIDSVMSSVSTASGAPSGTSTVSHSHQSSVDTTIGNAPDAASLIEASGGAVQAVEKLLRERHQQVARSEQLWKLLEKQRQMVHGMHADLEKALKDKEKYRRRVKEVEEELDRALTSLPPLPASASAKVTPTRPSLDAVYSSSRASPGTSSTSSGIPHSSRSLPDAAPSPVPTSTRFGESSQHDLRSPPLRKDSLPGSPLTPQAVQSKSSLSTPTEKLRKPAPAPLNLSQPSPRKFPPPDSDSEPEVQAPDLERGRKRTRADDDRHREALAIAEEMRSRSNKSKAKKATQPADPEEAAAIALPMSPPIRSFPSDYVESHETMLEPVVGSAELEDGLIAGIGLPSSPRAGLDMQLPIQNNASPASIASVLGGPSAHASPLSARPPSASTVTLPPKSPGLPMSPRPMDRPHNAPMPRVPTQTIAASGPLSPRGLPLSPRAPKYPIPTPHAAPNMLAAMSPHQRSAMTPSAHDISSMAERLQASQSTIHLPDAEPVASQVSPEPIFPNQIHRGYMSDDYPDLLLAPNALPLVKIKVVSTRLLPHSNLSISRSRNTSDEEVFLLGVHARANMRQLWRVEKTPSQLAVLDSHLKRSMNLSMAAPERGLFSGHAPAKLDQRKVALNTYFEAIFDSPMSERAALNVCNYFSHDVLEPRNDVSGDNNLPGTPVSPKAGAAKSGWLSKKGKQFGGWKSRWFVLEDCTLRNFTAPSGDLLGSIRLENAQVLQKTPDNDDNDEYRHFFCVVEQKRKDSTSTTRHVLCAESDDERDDWIQAIYVHIHAARFMASPPASPRSATGRGKQTMNAPPPAYAMRKARNGDSVDSTAASSLVAVNYDDTVPANGPSMGAMGTPSIMSTVPSPLPDDSGNFGNSMISGPRDAQPIPNSSLSAWGNKSSSPSRAKDKDGKKRSMFGFITRSNDDSAAHRFGRNGSPRNQRKKTGPVFGIPLADTVEIASVTTEWGRIPAVLFRCIQYLEHYNAHREEGILRHSGSAAITKDLRHRFDTEGDVDLVAGEKLDIHIIGGMFKAFVRDLPTNILTYELKPRFTYACDIEDPHERTLAVNYLIHQLPPANRATLTAVFYYLVKVTDAVDYNKMTIKNVTIIIAPSFEIPTPVVVILIQDYHKIFTAAPLDPSVAAPIVDRLRSQPPPIADEIEVSRRQMMASAVAPPAPPSPFNGSSTDVTLRNESIGGSSLREAISRPIAAVVPAALHARSRSRGSPSPASRPVVSAPIMRPPSPPREGGLYSNGNASGTFLPQSSNSSSPSSRTAPSGRPWDAAPSESASGQPTSRRAKRESTIAGLTGSLGHLPGQGSVTDASEPRKKSSYSRLKENWGVGSSRDA